MSFRISHVDAFISLDPATDEEGVCGFMGADGVMWPMVAANEERLTQLRPLARWVAQRSGRPVRLVRFTKREEMESVTPS